MDGNAVETPNRAHRGRAVVYLVSGMVAFLIATDLRGMHDVLVAVCGGTLAGTLVLLVPRRRRRKEQVVTKTAVLVMLARVVAMMGAILLPALALGAGGFGVLATTMLVCGIQHGVLAATTPESTA
jgi:hypothetical protein